MPVTTRRKAFADAHQRDRGPIAAQAHRAGLQPRPALLAVSTVEQLELVLPSRFHGNAPGLQQSSHVQRGT